MDQEASIKSKFIRKSCIMRNGFWLYKQRFLIDVKDKLVDVKPDVKQNLKVKSQEVFRTLIQSELTLQKGYYLDH